MCLLLHLFLYVCNPMKLLLLRVNELRLCTKQNLINAIRRFTTQFNLFESKNKIMYWITYPDVTEFQYSIGTRVNQLTTPHTTYPLQLVALSSAFTKIPNPHLPQRLDMLSNLWEAHLAYTSLPLKHKLLETKGRMSETCG